MLKGTGENVNAQPFGQGFLRRQNPKNPTPSLINVVTTPSPRVKGCLYLMKDTFIVHHPRIQQVLWDIDLEIIIPIAKVKDNEKKT